MSTKTIIKKKGKLPGSTVAIFGGIHGNERVGIMALDKLAKHLNVTSGTVYLVYANPLAIKKKVRMVNKNMNRLFSKENVGKTPEDTRARQLMKLLDTCDGLLDIHSYNSKIGDQFAIGEANTYKLVSKMDFPIVASGFSKMGHGTDGYMFKNGKAGLCIECGTSNKAKKFLPLAYKSALQFLQYYKNIDQAVPFDEVEQRKVVSKRIIYKKTKTFTFTKNYKDFESLEEGRVYATDGDVKYIASKNECILFPRPKVEIGGEVCIICSVKKA